MPRTLYSLCAEDGQRHYSPHVWKVILALKYKGLEFELKPLSFGGIKEINGGAFSSVPVLDDNGNFLDDSFKIVEHLETEYPTHRPVLLSDTAVTYARFVERYCERYLHPPMSGLLTMDMHDMMSAADQKYFRGKREKRFGKSLEDIARDNEGAAEIIEQALCPFADVLEHSSWLGGDEPSFADFILFGTLQWWRVCTPDKAIVSNKLVRDWFDKSLALADGGSPISLAG